MNQRQWLDYLYEKDMAAFRKKHGLAKAQSTGPASRGEIEEARNILGEPKTHEEWLAACRRARDGVL